MSDEQPKEQSGKERPSAVEEVARQREREERQDLRVGMRFVLRALPLIGTRGGQRG